MFTLYASRTLARGIADRVKTLLRGGLGACGACGPNYSLRHGSGDRLLCMTRLKIVWRGVNLAFYSDSMDDMLMLLRIQVPACGLQLHHMESVPSLIVIVLTVICERYSSFIIRLRRVPFLHWPPRILVPIQSLIISPPVITTMQRLHIDITLRSFPTFLPNHPHLVFPEKIDTC